MRLTHRISELADDPIVTCRRPAEVTPVVAGVLDVSSVGIVRFSLLPQKWNFFIPTLLWGSRIAVTYDVFLSDDRNT
jgi:hypothetical protein